MNGEAARSAQLAGLLLPPTHPSRLFFAEAPVPVCPESDRAKSPASWALQAFSHFLLSAEQWSPTLPESSAGGISHPPPPQTQTREGSHSMTYEELNARETELFMEWKSCREYPHKGFVADGIVDYVSYNATQPKLLFLLREPNCEGDAQSLDDDLRPGLREGGVTLNGERQPIGKWRSFQVIARWTYAITNAGKEIPWSDIDNEANELIFRRENLRKVAIVNMKKNGGKSACNWGELARYCAACGKYVRRQIELYQPRLVVCNGTGGLAEKYVFSHVEREAPRWTKNDIRWFPLRTWPCAVVDMWHFGARMSHQDLHDSLVNAWREICQAT